MLMPRNNEVKPETNGVPAIVAFHSFSLAGLVSRTFDTIQIPLAQATGLDPRFHCAGRAPLPCKPSTWRIAAARWDSVARCWRAA